MLEPLLLFAVLIIGGIYIIAISFVGKSDQPDHTDANEGEERND